MVAGAASGPAAPHVTGPDLPAALDRAALARHAEGGRSGARDGDRSRHPARIIVETARLTLRPLTADDLDALHAVLGDPVAMTAYEHGFAREETTAWIDRQREGYVADGFGLWAVVRDGEVVGDAGLTRQRIDADEVVEVGYHLRRDLWGRGFATEAARASVAWGFAHLGVAEIWAKVRDTNVRSAAVATRLGMTPRRRSVTRYRGVDMPHTGYAVDRTAWSASAMAS